MAVRDYSSQYVWISDLKSSLLLSTVFGKNLNWEARRERIRRSLFGHVEDAVVKSACLRKKLGTFRNSAGRNGLVSTRKPHYRPQTLPAAMSLLHSALRWFSCQCAIL
jgi:hypothetical protein